MSSAIRRTHTYACAYAKSRAHTDAYTRALGDRHCQTVNLHSDAYISYNMSTDCVGPSHVIVTALSTVIGLVLPSERTYVCAYVRACVRACVRARVCL